MIALRLSEGGLPRRRGRTDLAIIVPVFNEASNIEPLAIELRAALAPARLSYEIVFIDDGSTDHTWAEISRAQRYGDIRGLRHDSNRGQSAALWTGILATDSPMIATLDGDLQNDPADLPRLLAELAQADFVCGVRTSRKDPWLRRVSSRAAWRARQVILGVRLRDTGCGIRVFKRTALAPIIPFQGLHRFLPILAHWAGGVVKEIPVNHRPRRAGVSKYGVWNRLGCGLADLLAMAWYQKRRLPPAPPPKPSLCPSRSAGQE